MGYAMAERVGWSSTKASYFHTKTRAYQQTKRKLLDECDLWCVLSLPPGVFVNAGAGVKTNLLFFTKGRQTERVWYYDLSDVHITKKTPLTVEHFDDFFERLELPVDDEGRISERSWYESAGDIKAREYDLKATNANAPDTTDKRTPEELLQIIEEAQREISQAARNLRDHLGSSVF
jgi:type I restriction enzyme M protein